MDGSMTIYSFLKKVLRQNYSGSDNGTSTSQIEQKAFLVSRFIKYSAAGILLAFILYALMLVLVTWPVSGPLKRPVLLVIVLVF